MSLTKVNYSMINGAPVNVLDFGAVGDGVTDDTAAIQAALDSGIVGVIKLTDSVISAPLLPKSNQTLQGGKLTAASGSWINGIVVSSENNVTIDSVEMTGDFDIAVRFVGSFGSAVSNCNIHDIGNTSPEYGFGIVIGDPATPSAWTQNLKIVKNTIKNVGGNGNIRGDGIYVSYGSEILISENYIDTVNRMGVAITDSAHAISVVNNNIVSTALAGVDIEPNDASYLTYNILVDGNAISNYARSGFSGIGAQFVAVDVHSAVRDVVVSNNLIVPGANATQVFNCQNGTYDVQFVNNTVFDGGSLSCFLKTYAGSGTDNILVANNTAIYGNIDNFIDSYDGNKLTVVGNLFLGSGASNTFFVKIVDMTDTVISNNQSSGTTNFVSGGFGACSGLTVTSNTTTTLSRGIDLLATTTGIENIVITNNLIKTPASVGSEGVYIISSGGYIRNINLLNNVIPYSLIKLQTSASATGWSISTYNVRTDVAVPVAGQVIFELSTNKQIQYLSGAWVAPS